MALKDDGDPGDLKLHIVSRKGKLQEVKRLVEEELLDPLQKDKQGKNALHYAAWGGHSDDVLKYFIEDRGCNAACLDQDGHLFIMQWKTSIFT